MKLIQKVPQLIIMPPLGEAPPNSPQPGQPGGGEYPSSNAFAASLAPPGEIFCSGWKP